MDQENRFEIRTACIQLDVSASDWQEAIQKACQPLIDQGFVKPGYPTDVIAREKQWATGLPTMPEGVAIPHALDPGNVVDAQIAACRLRAPVKFAQSGGTEQDAPVEVRLVFILALKDPKAQLHLLQKLMVAISDEEMLTALLHAGTPSDFSNIFNGAEAGR